VLRHPAVRDGQWRLLECAPAWEGNGSNDAFIAFAWQSAGDARVLVAVDYASHHSQCRVRSSFGDLGGRSRQLRDLLGEAVYDRDGNELTEHGLYLDVAPWQCHVFELTTGS
jgi:hypothetical protein